MKNANGAVVGIGVSAQNIDALKSILQKVRKQLGTRDLQMPSIILLQSPNERGQILSTQQISTALQVSTLAIDAGMELKQGQVYLCSHHQQIDFDQSHENRHNQQHQQHRIRLVPLSQTDQSTLPALDCLFISLAKNFGKQAIGIILNQVGAAGLIGIKAIRQQHGLTIMATGKQAQSTILNRDDKTKYVADLHLKYADIPSALADYLQTNTAATLAESSVSISRKNSLSLQKIIKRQSGYDLDWHSIAAISQQVNKRMQLVGLTELALYVDLVEQQHDERNALVQALASMDPDYTHSENSWKDLTQLAISSIVQSKTPGLPIRVWIPYCGMGEETFSIALAILDHLKKTKVQCSLEIYATDTDPRYIEVAQRGIYPLRSLESTSIIKKQGFFEINPDQTTMYANSRLRSCVVFGVQELHERPRFNEIDLICCRHMLGSLAHSTQTHLLSIFHETLRPGGFLYLAPNELSESTPLSFDTRYASKGLLQRESEQIQQIGQKKPTHLVTTLSATNTTDEVDPQDSPMSHIAPVKSVSAGVMVDSRFQILYSFGQLEYFLVRSLKIQKQNVLDVLQKGIEPRLRKALENSAQTHDTSTENQVQMITELGAIPLQVVVMPQSDATLGTVFLITLHANSLDQFLQNNAFSKSLVLRELERELQKSRENLFASIKKYDAITLELRNANKQMRLSNEAVHLHNKRIEASNRELQAINEDLRRVNSLLDAKLKDLQTSHQHLQSSLVSQDLASISLDNALCLTWFSQAAKEQFHFVEADLGKPIKDFVSILGDEKLLPSLQLVMQSNHAQMSEFMNRHRRWVVRRVIPKHADDACINGMNITYTDITDIHLAIETATSERDKLRSNMQATEKAKIFSTALALAEGRERKALAKYLHDDFGQMLAVLAIKAVTLRKQRMSIAMQSKLDDCIETVNQLNNKMRQLAFQLSPPMLDQLSAGAALQWLADEFYHVYKVRIEVIDDDKPKFLNSTISAIVIRTIRELLAYITDKQRSQKIAMKLTLASREQLAIIIEGLIGDLELSNIGSEFGLKLLSMQERIHLIDGDLRIESTAHGGTRITIKVPMTETKQVPSHDAGETR